MDVFEDDSPLSRRGFLVTTVGTAAAAGVSATALAQEDEDDENGEADDEAAEENGDEDEDEDEEEEEPAEAPRETVIVGPGGDNVYEPEELFIEPGTVVEFIWESDNHNVNVTEQPGDADWAGHDPLEDDGFEFESLFEVEGEYEYVCDPHIGVGMIGNIIVDPDGGGGGAGGPQEMVPDAAWTLLIATCAGMVSVLSLAYAFMRYGDANPSE